MTPTTTSPTVSLQPDGAEVEIPECGECNRSRAIADVYHQIAMRTQERYDELSAMLARYSGQLGDTATAADDWRRTAESRLHDQYIMALLFALMAAFAAWGWTR